MKPGRRLNGAPFLRVPRGSCDLRTVREGSQEKGALSHSLQRVRREPDYKPTRGPGISAAERLAARTSIGGPEECWPCSGSSQRSGHKQIVVDGRLVLVHRLAWMLEHGPIPDGLVIRHRCDNPPCVNPAHLQIGTVVDNNRDRDERGRHRPLPGSSNGAARLNEETVASIKAALRAGSQMRPLARQYGVSQRTIQFIQRGETWKHVA